MTYLVRSAKVFLTRYTYTGTMLGTLREALRLEESRRTFSKNFPWTIIQIGLPVALTFHVVVPILVPERGATFEATLFVALMGILNLMLMALIVRLAARPNECLTQSRTRLTEVNSRLFRLLPVGTRAWREQEARAMEEIYRAEIYRGHRQRLLAGIVISSILIGISISISIFLLVLVNRPLNLDTMLLIAGCILMTANFALIPTLSVMREFWRKRLFDSSNASGSESKHLGAETTL